jgi:hypothetical protein
VAGADQPITTSARFDVTFEKVEDARRVHKLIQRGLLFSQAVDMLELRPLVHYMVVRTDTGDDGRC